MEFCFPIFVGTLQTGTVTSSVNEWSVYIDPSSPRPLVACRIGKYMFVRKKYHKIHKTSSVTTNFFPHEHEILLFFQDQVIVWAVKHELNLLPTNIEFSYQTTKYFPTSTKIFLYTV